MSLALQPHIYHSAINFLGASQTIADCHGQDCFLTALDCHLRNVSYAGRWMEWRNRAVAVIQLVSRIRPLRSLGELSRLMLK